MDDLTQQDTRLKSLMLTLWIALACAIFVKFNLQHGTLPETKETNPQLMQLSSTLTIPISTARVASTRQVFHLVPQAVTPAGQKGDLYVDCQGTLHLHNGQDWASVSLERLP